jgi:hypothetical protein
MDDLNTTEASKEASVEKAPKPAKTQKYSYYTYFLAFVVLCLMLLLLRHTYKCFQKNKCVEPFIIKQPRTDIQSDKSFDNSFDMDSEVKKLTIMQEKYLNSINK